MLLANSSALLTYSRSLAIDRQIIFPIQCYLNKTKNKSKSKSTSTYNPRLTSRNNTKNSIIKCNSYPSILKLTLKIVMTRSNGVSSSINNSVNSGINSSANSSIDKKISRINSN